MSTPAGKAAVLLRAAQDAKDRAALEDMVKHVIRSPELMGIVADFAERSLEAVRSLPVGHPDRRAYDKDAMNCQASFYLRDILSLSQSLRMQIRDAGPLPASALDRWQPPEGEAQ